MPYAEVPASRMSRATALAAVGQQVSLATGVEMANRVPARPLRRIEGWDDPRHWGYG
jgi:hypothetical protein